MATYALIPGFGGDPWEWHRLVPELESRGHEALAVRLPADDDRLVRVRRRGHRRRRRSRRPHRRRGIDGSLHRADRVHAPGKEPGVTSRGTRVLLPAP